MVRQVAAIVRNRPFEKVFRGTQRFELVVRDLDRNDKQLRDSDQLGHEQRAHRDRVLWRDRQP